MHYNTAAAQFAELSPAGGDSVLIRGTSGDAACPADVELMRRCEIAMTTPMPRLVSHGTVYRIGVSSGAGDRAC
jgi:hypothetical protein